jgi:hypothetical protein
LAPNFDDAPFSEETSMTMRALGSVGVEAFSEIERLRVEVSVQTTFLNLG